MPGYFLFHFEEVKAYLTIYLTLELGTLSITFQRTVVSFFTTSYLVSDVMFLSLWNTCYG